MGAVLYIYIYMPLQHRGEQIGAKDCIVVEFPYDLRSIKIIFEVKESVAKFVWPFRYHTLDTPPAYLILLVCLEKNPHGPPHAAPSNNDAGLYMVE